MRACVSLEWGIADMVEDHVRYRWKELVELLRIGHFWNDSTSPARLMIFQRFGSVLKESIFGITLRIWLRLTRNLQIRDLRVKLRRTVPVSHVSKKFFNPQPKALRG